MFLVTKKSDGSTFLATHRDLARLGIIGSSAYTITKQGNTLAVPPRQFGDRIQDSDLTIQTPVTAATNVNDVFLYGSTPTPLVNAAEIKEKLVNKNIILRNLFFYGIKASTDKRIIVAVPTSRTDIHSVVVSIWDTFKDGYTPFNSTKSTLGDYTVYTTLCRTKDESKYKIELIKGEKK